MTDRQTASCAFCKSESYMVLMIEQMSGVYCNRTCLCKYLNQQESAIAQERALLNHLKLATVVLTYYKPSSGKFYSSWPIKVDPRHSWAKIVECIVLGIEGGKRPGLSSNGTKFNVGINSEDHPSSAPFLYLVESTKFSYGPISSALGLSRDCAADPTMSPRVRERFGLISKLLEKIPVNVTLPEPPEKSNVE